MNLSALTADELRTVDTALNAMGDALAMLEDVGAIDEDGVDLLDLADAVGAELERRGVEDAEYKVAVAVAGGECMAVVRPDGQWGYVPVQPPVA